MVTATSRGFKEYPRMTVVWQRAQDIPDAPAQGPDLWIGEALIWTDGNTKTNATHSIHLGQTSPIGRIHCSLDPVTYGARAICGFEGTGINERDFQWATAWAFAILKEKCKDEINPPDSGQRGEG